MGPLSNPQAIGAQIRVRYRDGKVGPARSVQAGSGYWSQDGAVQVLGLDQSPQAIRILWPGGREQIVPVDGQNWDLRVAYPAASPGK